MRRFFNVRVHIACLPADEGFVYFHRVPAAAEFNERAFLYSGTNAVHHEPRGTLHDAQSASYFIAADSILAGSQEPHRGEPFVQRNGRVLEDGAKFDGELATAFLAFPDAAGLQVIVIFALTGGASHTVRPAGSGDSLNADFGVTIVADNLLKGFGLLWHNHLQEQH